MLLSTEIIPWIEAATYKESEIIPNEQLIVSGLVELPFTSSVIVCISNTLGLQTLEALRTKAPGLKFIPHIKVQDAKFTKTKGFNDTDAWKRYCAIIESFVAAGYNEIVVDGEYLTRKDLAPAKFTPFLHNIYSLSSLPCKIIVYPGVNPSANAGFETFWNKTWKGLKNTTLVDNAWACRDSPEGSLLGYLGDKWLLNAPIPLIYCAENVNNNPNFWQWLPEQWVIAHNKYNSLFGCDRMLIYPGLSNWNKLCFLLGEYFDQY